VALAAVGAVALLQGALVVQWMRFVRLHDGTRGPTYGTAVGAQIAALRAVCALPEPRIALRNETAQFRYPFEYLARTDPACADKTVVVCAEAPDRSPDPARPTSQARGSSGSATRARPEAPCASTSRRTPRGTGPPRPRTAR
jgi:hypothetical protein